MDLDKKPSYELTSAVVLEVWATVSDLETSVVAVAGLLAQVPQGVERRGLDDAVGVLPVAAFSSRPARALLTHATSAQKGYQKQRRQ